MAYKHPHYALRIPRTLLDKIKYILTFVYASTGNIKTAIRLKKRQEGPRI